MDFERFLCEVIDKLQEKLGSGYKIKEKKINGNNNIHRHALEVRKESGANIYPVIYVDDFYEQYITEGWDINKAAEEICMVYERSGPGKDIDISFFNCWETVKAKVFARLVNTEMNGGLLKEVPHREYLDLSLVYYVAVGEADAGDNYVIQVRNEYIQHWKVGETVLYDTAWENMRKADDITFEEMGDLLQSVLDIQISGCWHQQEPPMYVLSNKKRLNGAVQMGNLEALQRIGSFFKGDFWILPSSLHEIIVIPIKKMEDGAEWLAHLVRNVNEECVNPKEVLSYHVYRYCRFSGEVVIAA